MPPIICTDPAAGDDKLTYTMASVSLSGKLVSTFDALAHGARKLRHRPRLPFYLIALLALLSAGLFASILIEDRQTRADAMHRDIESASLQLGTRLSTLSETLSAAARDIGNGGMPEKRFGTIARDLLASRRELIRIERVDDKGRPVWPAVSSTTLKTSPATPPPAAAAEAEPAADPALKPILTRAGHGYDAVFATLASGPRGAPLLLAVPVYIDQQFAGAVVARIDLLEFIVAGIAGDALDRYRLTIALGDRPLAATSAGSPPANAPAYDVPLPPLPAEYRLRASGSRGESRFAADALVWVVAGLAIAVMVALGELARFTTRQQRIGRSLLAEITLRRAMEDSLATGLRVLDPQGVIRHVNRAFCQMTGFIERDLVGRSPPYPYWPPEHRAAHEDKLKQVLAGKAQPGGFEVVVQRKDGTRFDARMQVSPLLDEASRHIGWITSMADVTAATRARRELATSYDRVATVLDSLDAAVSVAIAGTGDDTGAEMVFANRAYVDRFGEGAAGHVRLVAQLRGRERGDILDDATDRWFDVRLRDIRWLHDGDDAGRAARLQIATDITLRKAADDLARQQQEKAQFASRLTATGELASSLAHELHQPLAAIADCSESALARLKERRISIDELQAALERTSIQAQRADGIVRRMREFVKRSEPRRHATPPQPVIDAVIGAVAVEAGRKGITIAASVDPTLAPLLVDPPLIEQVLLNLLRNAIDAMEHATVRRIDVVARRSLVDGIAEIAVIDRGSGIREEDVAIVFEPFFSTKPGGVGMGLNICRSIVEAHQGRLMVERNPERAGGTTIRFTLPLAVASNEQSDAAPADQGGECGRSAT